MLECVRTWGDPESPTVLLLHPAGGTRHSWTPHAERLRDSYHVVAIDLPAHGIHPHDEFSFDRAVEDVGKVLENIGTAVLVGHSQGGYVAMHAAAAHADQASRLRDTPRARPLTRRAHVSRPFPYCLLCVQCIQTLRCFRWSSSSTVMPVHRN